MLACSNYRTAYIFRIMYAVKGRWIGQTFALATSSDSSPKKTRVRRSKEERKSMIETFIKRYQGSNNGSFPSLSLTHKEVGGSFYIVREIVREIIQENRVLGPARFSPELDHEENVDAQYPLGSIAVEPQISFSHPRNEQSDVHIHQEERFMELLLDNKEHYNNHEHIGSAESASEIQIDKIGDGFDDTIHGGKCVDVNGINIDMDGSQINGLFDETNTLQAAESLVSESFETDKEFTLTEECKAQVRLPTEEVSVETFPLPVEKDTDGLGMLSTDSGIVNGTWNDLEGKPDGRPCMDEISSSVSTTDHESDVTTKGTNGSPLSVTERYPSIESNNIQVSEVVPHTEFNQISEASDFTESPEINEDSLVLHDPVEQISSPNAVILKTTEQLADQSKTAPKGATWSEERRSKNNETDTPFLSVSGNNHRREDKAAAASSPPVDRINLQSWEKVASKRQPNPVLAIFKSFADALVKFWS